MDVSVVVPVFNSQATLAELTERLRAMLLVCAEKWEIIFVNDCSLDQSWDVIGQLAREHGPAVIGLNLMRNYGQHNALLCGIRAAQYEVVLTLDDDLQNPPEEAARLLTKLAEGHDVVYGTPEREQHGLWRDLASQITKISLQSAMGANTARHVSTFRAFRTQLRQAFAEYNGPFVSIDVLLTWSTTRFASVPVRHDPRLAGASNYTFRKLVLHAVNMITGFSTLPLELASLLGFASTLFGLLVLAFVLGRYVIQGQTVPGFTFLASTTAVFSGVELFALGIIGEYLARIHFRTMSRPSYIIRDQTPLVARTS